MPDLFWLPSSSLPLPLTLGGVALLLLLSNRNKQVKVASRVRQAAPPPKEPVASAATSKDNPEGNASPVQLPPSVGPLRTRWRSISFTIQGDRHR